MYLVTAVNFEHCEVAGEVLSLCTKYLKSTERSNSCFWASSKCTHFSELMQCFSSFQGEASSVVMGHLCLLQEDSVHQSPVFLVILNMEYVKFRRSVGNFNFYAVLS